MKDTWAQRKKDGTVKEIVDKIQITRAKTYEEMTPEERKEKHDYMRDMPAEEKNARIALMRDASVEFWNTDSEEKDKAYKKAVKTKEDKGLITPRDQINESQKYKELVRHLTEKTYRKNKKLLNPLNLPRGMGRGKYHLDHKFSVSMGYINNIPVEIMASVYNLEIIESKENLVKHADCSITKEELLEAYYG